MTHSWLVASLLVGVLLLAGCIVVPVPILPFGWGHPGGGGPGGYYGGPGPYDRRGGYRW
jgi:hypothetical protein